MKESQDPLVHTLDTFQEEQEKVKEHIMSTRLTPKRAQAEQKKILLQTAMYVVLTIFLGLAMVLVVIPALIRFAGSLTGISNPANSDTVAPRIPIYSAPQEATKDKTLNMEGFGEPDSKIIAVLNSEQVGEVQADAEGKFTSSFELHDGENRVAFFSKDAAENESELGREYTIVYDTQAPEVTWEAPEDGMTVTNLRERMIEVRGKVVDSTEVKVYINDSIVFADSEGIFKDSYQLQEGENTLKLRVIDAAGNEVQQERKVTFRP